MPVSPIEEVLEEIRQGRLVVLVDDEGADSEGFLCAAAESITSDAVNFMMLHGRGLICLGLTEERMKQLGIPLMVQESSSKVAGSLGASIALRADAATAASAASRARTLRAAIAKETKRSDLIVPGFVFPVQTRNGGVLVRSARIEASVEAPFEARPAAIADTRS